MHNNYHCAHCTYYRYRHIDIHLNHIYISSGMNEKQSTLIGYKWWFRDILYNIELFNAILAKGKRDYV